MKRPVIILGAGGHGRVILDLLQKLNYDVRGFSDPDQTLWENQDKGHGNPCSKKGFK